MNPLLVGLIVGVLAQGTGPQVVLPDVSYAVAFCSVPDKVSTPPQSDDHQWLPEHWFLVAIDGIQQPWSGALMADSQPLCFRTQKAFIFTRGTHKVDVQLANPLPDGTVQYSPSTSIDVLVTVQTLSGAPPAVVKGRVAF